jgi:predicted Zn-dependent protease
VDENDALLDQARYLLSLGRHERAAQRLAVLLDADPQHVEAVVLASQVAMADGGDALPSARQAHALDPENPLTAWQLGWALLSADQPGEAEALAQRAVQLDPDDPDNHELLAEVRWRRGDVQRALVSAARCS